MFGILSTIRKTATTALNVVTDHPWQVGVIVLLGAAGYLFYQNKNLEADLAQETLQVQNLKAREDSTREVLRAKDDSVRYYQRQAVQAEQESDSLDAALDQSRKAVASLRGRIEDLRVDTLAADSLIVDTDSVRIASFTHDEEPYHVTLDVVDPPRPELPSIRNLHIRLDPFWYDIRIGCSEGEGQVRRADWTITTPDWVPQMKLRDVRQSPEICNPGLPKAEGGSVVWTTTAIGGVSGGLGGALVSATNSQTSLTEGILFGTLGGGGFGHLIGRLREAF